MKAQLHQRKVWQAMAEMRDKVTFQVRFCELKTLCLLPSGSHNEDRTPPLVNLSKNVMREMFPQPECKRNALVYIGSLMKAEIVICFTNVSKSLCLR